MEVIRLRAGTIDWREIEGEVVAVNLRTATYLAVNRSGALLWPALIEGTTRNALIERLVEGFDISPATAESDVDAFLGLLAEQDLVEKSPS